MTMRVTSEMCAVSCCVCHRKCENGLQIFYRNVQEVLMKQYAFKKHWQMFKEKKNACCDYTFQIFQMEKSIHLIYDMLISYRRFFISFLRKKNWHQWELCIWNWLEIAIPILLPMLSKADLNHLCLLTLIIHSYCLLIQ